MLSNRIIPLLFAILTLVLPFQAWAEDQTLTQPVNTSDGPVVGEVKEGVNIFRGIPYAAPPMGEKRWAPPAPVSDWTTPRPCLKFGRVCPQFEVPSYGKLGEQSEDCLYLNIWSTGAQGDNKPVLVWVHGGGFYAGAASQATYDGIILAKTGVVVVSLNYRLGPFGFMAHPAFTVASENRASGNYGIMDQAAALQWVHANIAAFGGDSSNVTVMGESAGAASVAALMCTHLAKGTFQKAILMSSSHSAPQRKLKDDVAHIESLEKVGLGIAERLGVPATTPLPDALVALRGKSAEDVLKAAVKQADLAGAATTDHLGVDGFVLNEPIVDTFHKGRQALVPAIIGNVADEGTLFAKKLKAETLADLRKALELRFGPNAELAQRVYPAKTDAEAKAQTVKLCSDVYFHSSWRALRGQVREGVPVYRYIFTRKNPKMVATGLGVLHGSELGYFFGTIAADPVAGTPEDLAMSEQVRRRLINFCKSGSPNTPDEIKNVPFWYRYTRDDSAPMIFGLPQDTVPDLRDDLMDNVDDLLKFD